MIGRGGWGNDEEWELEGGGGNKIEKLCSKRILTG